MHMRTTKWRPLVALWFLGGLLLIGCWDTDSTKKPQGDSKSAYVLPSEITVDFTAERGDDGTVFVVGSTNLPDGTKLGAEITEPGGGLAQDYDIFVRDGKFRSQGFSNGSRPIPPGKRNVHMLAYFNGAWQSREVLQIVGEGGARLRGQPIKLEDPDVTDSDKLVDLTKVVDVPAVDRRGSALGQAPSVTEEDTLESVKHAVLTVDGRKSATDLEANVELFMQSPGIHPAGGWSVQKPDNGKFLVTYDFIDGEDGEQQAIWEFDPVTRKVRYLNKRAKLMSWTPAE